ncbi:MAG TPA: Gfo/Idh/MocA family oxidoreductase [Limnochordia bacterium]|nr:Gfo/Idh/MocA family oxidoreductase [Limnochordia bacterium]
MSKKLRVAVIGAGNIGRRHAQIHHDSPLTEFVAVCDIVKEKAERFARDYGLNVYTSVDDLLKNEQLDLVSVTTAGVENGSHHYEPTMQALAAGVGVLAEKPLCNDFAQAKEMVETAEAKNLYLGCDLNHRFVPFAAKAKAWMQEGKIGQPLFCNMALWINNPNESSPWFHLRALHAHSVDVMRYFCGDVVQVQAFLSKAPGRKIWSVASINMAFANGAVGHLTGSYDMSGHHPIERCEVGGDAGRFVLENVNESLTLYPRQSPERIVLTNQFMSAQNFSDTFRNRINRFLQQVSEGVDPQQIEGSGREALAAEAVIEAAIRSHEEGRVVPTSEFL